ncbi:protein of unknown function [Brevefilum fermentans]|uniref:Uncharacterized protein n=1 Tax=Candidatus Brevifilum fermentans TaxID=1986204 RepID=A0A1Y6K7I8_9CHLR|nr:protein of unknown function [Brevefilum fermentans]
MRVKFQRSAKSLACLMQIFLP